MAGWCCQVWCQLLFPGKSATFEGTAKALGARYSTMRCAHSCRCVQHLSDHLLRWVPALTCTARLCARLSAGMLPSLRLVKFLLGRPLVLATAGGSASRADGMAPAQSATRTSGALRHRSKGLCWLLQASRLIYLSVVCAWPALFCTCVCLPLLHCTPSTWRSFHCRPYAYSRCFSTRSMQRLVQTLHARKV